MSEEQPQVAAGEGPKFEILRIYLKDASFETPNSPSVFLEENKPEISVEIKSSSSLINDDVYEVVLDVTATSSYNNKTYFLVEVQQAGIFTVKDYDDEQKGSLLGSYCQKILFPFAREAISDLVTKGSFPQLLLAPINFDALYAQQQNESDAPQNA